MVLVVRMNKLNKALDYENIIIVFSLDFARAFDMVHHDILLFNSLRPGDAYMCH